MQLNSVEPARKEHLIVVDNSRETEYCNHLPQLGRLEEKQAEEAKEERKISPIL